MPSIKLASAANSTLVDDAAEIQATTGVLNLICTLKNTDGDPIVGVVPTFSSTGTGNTFTPTSTVTNASGVYLCAFSSTVAEAKTITATFNGLAVTQTAAVTVTAGAPAAPTLVFASEWDTATGGGLAAVTDTGRATPWSGRVDEDAGNPAQNLSVVAASGVTLVNGAVALSTVGWPTTNALKATWVSPSGVRSAGIVYCSELWTHPAIGESVYWRTYFCHDGDDADGGSTDDNSNHSFQSIGAGGAAGAGAGVWQLLWGNRGAGGASDGTFRFTVTSLADSTANNRFRSTVYLDKGATYRIEYRAHRVAEYGLELHIRVYDSSNVLVAQDSDFVLVSSSTTLADDPELGLEADDITSTYLRNLAVGAVGTGMPTGTECYYGAFAVSRTAWCGPYVASEGPV